MDRVPFWGIVAYCPLNAKNVERLKTKFAVSFILVIRLWWFLAFYVVQQRAEGDLGQLVLRHLHCRKWRDSRFSHADVGPDARDIVGRGPKKGGGLS